MTYVNKTNRFFKENVYSNLARFAVSPISWAFTEEPITKPTSFEVLVGALCTPVLIPESLGKILVAFMLMPILAPITIVTSAIALYLAGIAALFHGLSLVAAGITDVCLNDDAPTMRYRN